METADIEEIYSEIDDRNAEYLIIPSIYKMKVHGGHIYWRDINIIKSIEDGHDYPIHFCTAGVFVPIKENQNELQDSENG